jgi:hypothetical protein
VGPPSKGRFRLPAIVNANVAGFVAADNSRAPQLRGVRRRCNSGRSARIHCRVAMRGSGWLGFIGESQSQRGRMQKYQSVAAGRGIETARMVCQKGTDAPIRTQRINAASRYQRGWI